MSHAPWTLRVARIDEMARIVAIDDDASALFAEAGRSIEMPFAFVLAEQTRWREACERGELVVAVTPDDEAIGFASFGLVDAAPFLEQLSVRRAWMKRGVGRALLSHAIAWGRGALWLTTYADLAWNRPFYERMGFACVDESRCGPELRRIVDEERRALPSPEQRVVMARA